MAASQTRSQAVRQSLHLRIEPSPYTSSKVLLTAHTPSSAAMMIRAESENPNPPSGNEESIIFSVLCMYDFEAVESGLLSFKRSEILDVIKRDDTGWWAAMRQEGSVPVVGWIPQAYVSPLSEEMADKLRNLGEEFRIPEYDAERLYNSAPIADALIVFEPDSPAPEGEDAISLGSTSNSSATVYHCPQEITKSSGKRKEYVNSPRSRPNPPPSPTSPMPHPPSRSGSLKKSSKCAPPPSDTDNRTRSGSLSSNRSLRRRPVILNDNTTLSRLSTLIESNNAVEIEKLSSPDIAGSFQALSKRNREEKVQRRTMSEGTNHHIHHNHANYTTGKPWYLLQQQINHLDEDAKGHVRTGTLSALIEKLTTETPTTDITKMAESRAFTNVFLMTFRTFTTSNRFFELLVDRFYLKPPKALTETERKDWKANLRLPVQRRVLEIFGIWLQEYRLLEEEPHIAQRLTEFLGSVSGPLDLTAEAILKALERLTFTVSNKVPTTASAKKARKSKAYKNDLLKLDPTDLAEQLTLLEFSLYVKITPQECLNYAKAQSGESIARLQEFCSTHDKVGSWVKASILNNDALSRRADTVEYWIKVAEKCRQLNNLASMSAIIIALSSTVITRLHLTWAHVGRKSNLDVLLRHNEPTGGFAGYRTLLQNAEGPCVPFITMFLTDILHVQEQFGKQEDGQICFFQRARWYEIVTNILRFQCRPYSIAPSDSTINFIETHLRETTLKDTWFWARSKVVQSSELAHADIRKGLEAAGF